MFLGCNNSNTLYLVFLCVFALKRWQRSYIGYCLGVLRFSGGVSKSPFPWQML